MMNNKLYKKLVIAMMITTISAVAAASAADTTASVRPVDLAQAESIQARAKAEQQEIKAEKAQQRKAARAEAKAKKAADAVRPVDITPELREELAQKIADDAAKSAEKAADKRAKNQEIDPVIVIGRVPTNGTVDLNLPKTVQMALDYNRDIKNSQYALKKAEYAINQAQAGKKPTVDYNFGAQRSRATDAATYSRAASLMGSANSISNAFSNGISVNIPLYTGGLVEGQIDVAKLGKTNAQEEILRVEQATKYSAIEGYYGLLAYQELQGVYHEAVDNLQGHLDNVQAQYNVGTKAKVDVLSSDVSLANAKTTAITADNNVAIAESNLNNILGLPLETKLNLADHQLPFDTYNISLQEAMDYAMKYRPEVLQAAIAVQEAERSIDIADAGNKPTVAITGGNDWADNTFPGIDANKRSWKVAAGVTYNFYDGGATKAKVNQAKQDLLVARETEQKTRESVQLQVKQAYLNIRSAAQKVEETQTVVDQARENYRIQNIRYQAGVGINLDVLDAQLSLNQAQVNHIQALYDYNVGIAKLEQVMGVDVESGVIHPSLTATTYRG
ncbi:MULTISPECIES: TolC family protein [Megasphaera]|jgi:outer membrane protein TolC|uniref:TolC family protein n=1 Tax=Megasphaera TaxID=906 RepID=UPI000AE3DC1D|nr:MULTISPECIES: TolC family protein [Megasphaera]MCI6749361.1 TolC family protein [Megasphaera elsdenii]MCI6923779.1 TolC family protein [Megasphaera elsdenii]MCI7060316.1 TolC family protein [Megasphaera elsdenii]MCI7112002.1 TolC family protein [Megasphaera elsdenii]MCI7200165.1 TolC family protein [Megasphaera elsdenii]